MKYTVLRLATLAIVFGVILTAVPVRGDLVTATWIGGDDDWKDANNWGTAPPLDPPQWPNNGNGGYDYSVVVAGGNVAMVGDSGESIVINEFNLNGSLSFVGSSPSSKAGLQSIAKNGNLPTFTANGPTNIDDSSLYTDRAVVRLLQVENLHTNQNTSFWQADGPGSQLIFSGLQELTGRQGLFVEALNGGQIDLSHATSFDASSSEILADGGTIPDNSMVDLSDLETYAPAHDSTITARNGGTVALGTGTVTMTGATVNVEAQTGTLSVGGLLLDGGTVLGLLLWRRCNRP